MKALWKLIRGIFLVANIIIAILMAVAAYSGRFSPEDSLAAAYLGLVFPAFCVLVILFVFGWALARRWKYTLIGVLAFIVCWGPVKRYHPLHRKVESIPQENTIKVLTYNVMNFAHKTHTPASPNKIVEYIANSGADIVCIQEYLVHRKGDGLQEKAVVKALNMYPYRYVFNEATSRAAGIAVLSKFPIRKSRKLPWNNLYNGSSIHELDVNGKKLILVNNHLESFRLTREDRSQYSNLIKSMDTDALEGIRYTFQDKLGPAFIKRAKQARMVAEETGKAEGDYYIICGDFNDTPASYAHRTIQGKFLDAFEESGKGAGITYNQNIFRFRIDNILHSANIKAYNCTVDKVNYSDHYPMWCYLELK